MDSTQDGIALQAFILSIGLVFLLTVFVILFFVRYQRRLLAQQELRQKVETEYQRDLLKTTINSQEAERNRIAIELHDEIGAMLTTTKLYSSQIQPGLEDEALMSVTDKMNLLFDDMIQNTRRISQDLRPVILEKLGLIEGLESMIGVINESGKIEISFSQSGIHIRDKQNELNLYRIIQELLNNTLKHAAATVVHISLVDKGGICKLTYRDNGKGIDFSELKSKKGIGIKSIESRVSILAGKIQFNSIEKGMEIEIEIPNIDE